MSLCLYICKVVTCKVSAKFFLTPYLSIIKSIFIANQRKLQKLCSQIGKLISISNSVPVLVIKHFLLESVLNGLENLPWRRFSQILSNLSGIDTHKLKIFRLLLKNYALNGEEKTL